MQFLSLARTYHTSFWELKSQIKIANTVRYREYCATRLSLSLFLSNIYIFSLFFTKPILTKQNPNRINRDNRNASSTPRGATILQTIRREQNKWPHARIVIKIRSAVPGSNKRKPDVPLRVRRFYRKDPPFKRLKRAASSYSSLRGLANYRRWMETRIKDPPTHQRGVEDPFAPVFYARFPLKNRRGSLTGAGLFPSNAFLLWPRTAQ